MRARSTLIIATALLTLWTTGCASHTRLRLLDQTGGNAALFSQFQAYDAHSGRPVSFDEVARRCAAADVVLFGEEHSDTVCNQLQAQLLSALAARPRPVALAMEFFEADTQPSLDAYLADRIAEPPFRTQTRQRRAYVRSHRPLIEFCRALRIPVIAANAPRSLVRQYRKSDLAYAEFRAALDPTDQRWLPRTCEHIGGAYAERFRAVMADHGPTMPPRAEPTATTAPAESQPTTAPAMTTTAPVSQPAMSMPGRDMTAAFYRAHLLWDEAMAESLASFRERFGRRRVMLIVGVFHVAHDGGTATKFRRRRPYDNVTTIVYHATPDVTLPFNEEDRHAGDIVIYGIEPPPEKKAQPTTAPTATAPATMTETSP